MATAVGEIRAAKRRRGIARAPRYLATALVAILIGAGAWTWWRIHVCLPQLDGTVQLRGLSAPVEILRDARGVPHIRAQTIEDAYLAQGYVTSQDRLWQMDLSRRLAEGELSEIFGRRTLERDRENRTLGFSEIAQRSFEDLPPDLARLLTVYTRGVNAFISTHLDRLPVEFALLRYQPRPWREADSIAVALNMVKTLNSSWRTDLEREQIRSRLTSDLYADLFPDASPLDHPVAEPVAGPVRAAAPDAATVLPALQAPRGRSFDSGTDRALDPVLDAQLPDEAGGKEDESYVLGSNNWVVDGAHTASGKPLLSNDPHLGHSIPSVWYMVHLEAPGLNVTGVSLPGGPGVKRSRRLGHDQHRTRCPGPLHRNLQPIEPARIP
jgi:penicillin G amidase